MSILNIAGYKFLPLTEIVLLQQHLLAQCQSLCLKGTILLSEEGININLSGNENPIQSFQAYLKNDARFMDMTFHESYSNHQPFKRLNVKLKNEIITLRQPDVSPALTERAPDISPEELKRWIDEKHDFTLLDTRNDYEVRFGTFKNAAHLQITDFGQLPHSIEHMDRDKPIVMFCTGGIRCEKAAVYMLNQGFSNVQQLDGGILGYFKKVGGDHYEGECFVFDERIALDCHLEQTGTVQCKTCQGPISTAEKLCVTCHPLDFT